MRIQSARVKLFILKYSQYKQKEIEKLIDDSKVVKSPNFKNQENMFIVSKLKKINKDLLKELERKCEEMEQLKKSVKATKLNEIEA